MKEKQEAKHSDNEINLQDFGVVLSQETTNLQQLQMKQLHMPTFRLQ